MCQALTVLGTGDSTVKKQIKASVLRLFVLWQKGVSLYYIRVPASLAIRLHCVSPAALSPQSDHGATHGHVTQAWPITVCHLGAGTRLIRDQ